MAKIQSRRTISVNRHVYEAMSERAYNLGISNSQYIYQMISNDLKAAGYQVGNLSFASAPLVKFCDCGNPGQKQNSKGFHGDNILCDDCLNRDGRTKTEFDIIRYLSNHPGGHTLHDISRYLGYHHRHVLRTLRTLIDNGRIRSEFDNDSATAGGKNQGLLTLYLLLPYADRHGQSR